MANEEKVFKARLIQKHKTEQEWQSNENKDFIPMPGEFVIYDADTENLAPRIKIGDGETKIGELPFATGGGAANVQIISVGQNGEVSWPENPKDGDIVIVVRDISNDKKSRTAYIYEQDLGEWAALDGNYDADNVYFDEDLITSYAIGQISLNNGMATIPAAGKNLKEVWEQIYVKEINTDLKNTVPSCNMSGNSTNYYLIGATSAAQTITLTLNKGKYDYGYGYVASKDETDPAAGTKAVTIKTNDGTGVVPVGTSPYILTYNGNSINPEETNGNEFICPGVTKTSAPSQVTAIGKIKYEKAGNPVSNLGNIYPAQAYEDGTTSNNEKVLSRWYLPQYKGFTYTGGTGKTEVVTNYLSIDATRLQKFDSTTGADAYNKVKTTTATATKSWRQYFYAFPADYGWVMSGAKDSNGIDCTVQKCADVNLVFNNITVPYRIYCINNAADYDTLGISWTI